MDKYSTQSDLYKTIVKRVESLQSDMLELFGEKSSENGLFSYRSTNMQQLGLLASSFHQMNTIDYLENNQTMSNIFDDEIEIAIHRTRNYEHKALEAIKENLDQLIKYESKIEDLISMVSNLSLRCKKILETIKHSFYENILISLMFYLDEIRQRILEPAYKILSQENTGTSKLLDTVELRQLSKKEITAEEIARACELLSWGLEIPPGWKSIQSDTNELSDNLEKKIGSLRAMATSYYNM